jgi:hypothetical protein
MRVAQVPTRSTENEAASACAHATCSAHWRHVLLPAVEASELCGVPPDAHRPHASRTRTGRLHRGARCEACVCTSAPQFRQWCFRTLSENEICQAAASISDFSIRFPFDTLPCPLLFALFVPGHAVMGAVQTGLGEHSKKKWIAWHSSHARTLLSSTQCGPDVLTCLGLADTLLQCTAAYALARWPVCALPRCRSRGTAWCIIRANTAEARAGCTVVSHVATLQFA